MKRTLKNILMIALILLMVCAMFFTMKYAKSNRTTAKNNQSIEQGESNNEGDMQEPPEMPDNQDMKELDKKQNNLSYAYYIAFGAEGLILSISLVYLIISKFNKINVKEIFANKNKIIILIISIFILTSILTVLDIYLTNNYFLNTSNSKMTDGMMERDDNKKPSGNSGSSVSYTGVKEITEATNLTITTSGTSSATIRTDRGGGTISVLNDSDSSYNNIDFNGYKLYANGVAINN